MKLACVKLELLLCLGLVSSAAGETKWTLTNPTGRTYQDEVVRLKVDLPDGATDGEYVVQASGKQVASQIGEADGRNWIWVAASLGENETVEYTVAKGRPSRFTPKVAVKKEDDNILLDNGTIAVKIPAAARGDTLPGPIRAVRIPGGRWVGASAWKTARQLKNFSAEVLGNGTVFGKVRLRYDFEGTAGLYKNIPSFAVVDVSVLPGQQHVVIEESHEMDRGDYWEFDCAAGWGPRSSICEPHSRMPAHGGPDVGMPTTLKPGQTRMGETLLNLMPRWSQAFDEGWFFACHDGRSAVGAMVCRAARWHWPHNNMIEIKVKPSGDYAGLRCPTWKGRRYWFLLAGPKAAWDEKERKEYVSRHGFQPLDKLQHDFILDWPDLERILGKPGEKNGPKLGRFQGMDLFSSSMNPTSMLRGFGRRAIAEAGKQGDLGTLTQAQVFLDGDTYGSYWNYWSPENPNFFTDFIKCGIALTTQLERHPRFRELARLAEQKFHEDVYHTITLPGGAGQECPGYVAYAMQHWQALAPICKKHLGFDPTKWPRFSAGASFLLHVSQPIGGGRRRCHPGGDTHPLGPDVFAVAAEFGVREDVKQFQTEELPGFGVVFRNHPGTDRETYLAFKSGPNRGHFHGDQLSLHYCADARQVAIDHMCSYGPRAGQEHMHNRVAFHTDKLPWANMDGYERLIAVKTARDCDVAIGQVESERLRITTQFPPEEWDTYLPEQRFDRLLKYRRTIICLKNGDRDYFVIRDQHEGPPVKASYCLHVLSDKCQRSDNMLDFGNLTMVCVKPREFGYGRHDWDFEKKDRNGDALIKEHTRGIRLTVEGPSGEFITVLYPGNRPPRIEALDDGVRVGGDEVTFGGGIDDVDGTTYVAVKREGKLLMDVTGKDVDMDRSQGEIGLFVPDAGYPFGVIPDWLIRQRAKVPDWAPAWAGKLRQHELPQ